MIWHLRNDTTSLLFSEQQGRLSLNYLGTQLQHETDLSAGLAVTDTALPHGELSLPHPPLVFPTNDGADNAQPAIRLAQSTELWLDFQVRRVDQGPTTRFCLEDTTARISAEIVVSAAGSAWVWQTRIENRGDLTLDVQHLAALHLPLPHALRSVTQLGGYWANEFQNHTTPLTSAAQQWSSDNGRSSHASSASLLFTSSLTGENSGDALQTALQWPGNHRLAVYPTAGGGHAAQLGCSSTPGELRLAPGARLECPPVLIAFSDRGLNGLRAAVGDYWKTGSQHRKPVSCIHFNSWEGCYFDHDEARAKTLADQAAALGAERFVLDDGWMAGRRSAGLGLGDWQPCPDRYPQGLGPLADHVRQLGMSFGLWVEPEMVTLDSDIALQNPHWVIGHQALKPAVSGREQYLLDLRLAPVRNHILASLDRLIADCGPDYLKWDMNRDYAQVSVVDGEGPLALTRHWLGLVRELRRRHPGIALELCGAGGARADAGAMAEADRLWPTDSLDPVLRFRVLRQASLLLPFQRMGWHIGHAQAETSGMTTPLATRCILSFLGDPGIELDPARLADSDKTVVNRWLDYYVHHRQWLSDSKLYFLESTGTEAQAAILLSEDLSRALLVFLQVDYPGDAYTIQRRVPHLDVARRYRLRLQNPEDCDYVQERPKWMCGEAVTITGEVLTQIGVRQPPLRRHHCALIELQEIAPGQQP